jgi:hypothetical protein
MHLRAEIKSKAKAILIGHTVAGQRVYSNRFIPTIDEDDTQVYPEVRIYCVTEQNATFDTMHDKRSPELIIECGAIGADADDVLDVLAGQVEDLLAKTDTLEGIASTIGLSRTEIGVDEARPSVLVARMIYPIEYFAVSTTASTTDDYLTSVVEYEHTDVVDTIEMPQ